MPDLSTQVHTQPLSYILEKKRIQQLKPSQKSASRNPLNDRVLAAGLGQAYEVSTLSHADFWSEESRGSRIATGRSA